MIKFGKWVVKHRVLIIIIAVLLLIPSVIGMVKTRINYDMLTYLPEDMDTVKGQNILLDDFGKGAFSLIVVEGMDEKDIADLTKKLEDVNHVDTVMWYSSLADISIPMEMLPEKYYNAFNNGDTTMMAVFFDTSTSSDDTIQAIKDVRSVCGKDCFVTGMSALVTDLKDLCEKEEAIYVGIAVPGLSDNLALSDGTDIDIPSSVTIKADVTDFSLATTLTVATNDVFNKVSIDDDDTVEEIEDKLDTLDSSMKQIVDGASELHGYLTQLLDKSGELIEGVAELDTYANQISQSVDKLYKDGVVYIDGKLAELSSGLSTLSGNSAQLNAGAKQVYDTLLGTVETQLKAAGLDALGIKVPALTVDNYAAELNKLVNALDETSVRAYATQIAKKTVTDKVNASEAQITAAVTEAVKTGVTNTIKTTVVLPKVLASQNLTMEQYNALPAAVKSQIDAAVDAQMQSETVQSAITAQMATDKVKKTISDNVAAQKTKLISENMAGTEVQTQINAAVTKAKDGAAQIKSAKESLDSYATFYQGVLAYTAGTDTAAAGSAQLSQGYTENITANVKTLSDKLKEYVAGIDKLNTSAPAFKDAVSQITDGAGTLADGTSKFYDEGIKAIIDKIDDITPVITRLKATLDISRDYQSFGGKSDDMTGSTKFIYRTESIEK